MFQEEYQKLTSEEKESFSRIVNDLLSHTYLLETDYNFSDGVKRSNADYLFTERHLELMQEYLEPAGFSLELDSSYGVIMLRSMYPANRHHFNKDTTLVIYTLRLIYEEKRKEVNLNDLIFTSPAEVMQKMETLGAIDKRFALGRLESSLRAAARYRLIDKSFGKWTEPETQILIEPSILFIVSSDQISSMQQLIRTEEDEQEEETDEDA